VILTDAIREIHAASRGVYGARRVHTELTLGRRLQVWHGTVSLLMNRAGLKGIGGHPKWRRPHPDLISTDLVDRQFSRPGLNQLGVTDITEHPTREGKVYCAVVLDVYSRRVVGWSIDSSPTAALVTNALGMAIEARMPSAARRSVNAIEVYWLPASVWWISPVRSVTPARPRVQAAMSRVSVTRSARMVRSAFQPTIILECTSRTNAT
jgi:transposase InsO family protein